MVGVLRGYQENAPAPSHLGNRATFPSLQKKGPSARSHCHPSSARMFIEAVVQRHHIASGIFKHLRFRRVSVNSVDSEHRRQTWASNLSPQL